MGAISKHEDGSPVMTDGKVEALQTQHSLTRPEAEQLFLRVAAGDDEASAVEQIKGARTVYRVHHEAIPNPTSNPLALADKRRKEQEKEQERATGKEAASDKAAPEAGPYGTETPYTEATGTVTRKSDLYK